MLRFSFQRVSLAGVPFEAVAIDAVSCSRVPAATYEPPPWPLVVVLPLITGLSITLWAGIARFVGMFVTN